MTRDPDLLIGTYTSGHAALGVYLCALDAAHGIHVRAVGAAADPSFLVRHPQLPLAYAVNEAPRGHGGVSVLALDLPSARIAVLQQVDSGGEAPCHIAVAADASGLVVAHYGCGTVRWLGLDEAGRCTGASHVTRHELIEAEPSSHAGPRPRRQAAAHPHCVVIREAGIYVTDLGQDCIVRYRLDARHGLIELDRCAIHAGAGPRHLCFAADGNRAYVGNELDNTVSTLAVGAGGRLTERSWCSSLPAGCTQRSAVGEVALHPGGRWLYVSNRGFDSVAWYNVADGELQWAGCVPSQGGHPRHFAIAPDGTRLVAANRDAGNLVAWRIDPASGALREPGVASATVPAPVCICWLT